MILLSKLGKWGCKVGHHTYEHSSDFVLSQRTGVLWTVEVRTCKYCPRFVVSDALRVEFHLPRKERWVNP